MAGGRLSCCFTSLLLLGVFLRDVETSSCDRDVYKGVGETVEMASCSAAGGVTLAQWRYNKLKIVDNNEYSFLPQFKGRLQLNPESFNLNVTGLTLQDSGDFTFISEEVDKQRPTVTITLHVREPITTKPVLTSNSSWHASNGSCGVSLQCRAAPGGGVTYSWAVGNHSSRGPGLHYVIAPRDGDTAFTCFVSNGVSDESASVTLKCSRDAARAPGSYVVVILAAAGGGFLIVMVMVGVAVCVCRRKQRQADSNELTVYADIGDVAIGGAPPSPIKPCTLYETIDHEGDAGRAAPQTVYDQIQLSRMRKDSASPYQEIS
ncbi:SLAM family member 5 [Liparis tanakae]|uniref:SLAM family member 5 n=1 Tax=Liparis tanakae TaxID=230148 RepID=A0A4Z2F8F5_9TELE|nr:SLAM family member 5 [Liparis tanakae]